MHAPTDSIKDNEEISGSKCGQYKPAVVIPVYNRPEALARLLDGVNKSHYPFVSVELIISIEFGATSEVIEIADRFRFKHGNKIIVRRSHKLGLKNHIVACADLSAKFGSVLILEDDLMVSPDFYLFAVQALSFYHSEPMVAGISLYSQRHNETAQLPFEPLPGQYSVYFMQLACSWGQAWTASQWADFRNWMEAVDTSDKDILPENIKKWGGQSWKKAFNLYLLQTNKYFVYPYRSFTTNNSEIDGTHLRNKGGRFQVPFGLPVNGKPVFQFPLFEDQIITYDMYMEGSSDIAALLTGKKSNRICLDLYGTKPDAEILKFDYVISPRRGPKPICSYPLTLKPHEQNLQMSGYHEPFFFLYSKKQISELKPLTLTQYAKMASYFSYYKILSRRFSIGFLLLAVKKIFSK